MLAITVLANLVDLQVVELAIQQLIGNKLADFLLLFVGLLLPWYYFDFLRSLVTSVEFFLEK